MPFTNCLSANLSEIKDPNTDARLLPSALRSNDNSRCIRHYKTALKKAMENCISTTQKEQILLFYVYGWRKCQIAKKQNKSCGAITKSLRNAEKAVKAYVDDYMSIFKTLEQEFLKDE